MRIGLITHTFVPEFIGGREKHVEALAKVLGEKDEVFVFTGSRTKKVIKELKDNYTLYRIPLISVTLSKNPLQVYRIIPGLLKVLSSEEIDILHAHGYGLFTSDVSALYSKISNIPLVLTFHGCLFGKKLKLFKKIYDKTVGRFELQTVRKMIATSNSLKDEIISSYNVNNIEIIPNGIFLDQYQHESLKREELIISVGRILPRKGFSYLVDAAEEIIKDHPNVKFMIIGPDGGDKQNIIKKINNKNLKENVELKGIISDEMLHHLLSISSLFVIPSLYEPFGLVALEAMAMGCPIVSTNVGGLSEIIEHNRTGLLVPPANSKALANSIRLLLDNRQLAERLAKNAEEKVREFEWTNIGKRTREVYEKVLSNKKIL